MNTLLQDLRYALRQLRRSPGFTLTAVLTLALGIGALTTVATWTNAVLYNPWPHVVAPRTLRFVDATVLGSQGYSVHYGQYRFLREQGHSFGDAAAFAITSVNLAIPGSEPRAISAGIVSSNYFQLLGIKPQTGRFFQPGANDRAYGANDEIVLSDSLWRERFGADPNMIGRAVSINRHVFTVIGIAPAEFAGIFGGLGELAWIPLSGLRDLSSDAAPDPLLHYGLQVVTRLHPGVQDSVAAAELHTLARTFAQQQHAASRRREVAIRTTLGAAPGRIAAQVLVETGLLALTGALAGWAASTAMSRALYVLLPNLGMPLAFNLKSDAHILLFVCGVAMVVTLVCGMHPVRQSLRVSQNEVLHEGGAAVAGGSRKKMGQRILLGLQLGICFVVLVCCGLLTRTVLNIVSRDIGFDRANCLTASIDLSRSGYTKESGLAFQAALLDRLRNARGVTGATVTSHLPMGDEGSGNTQDFSIPGYVPAKGEDMEVVTDFDGPDFFHIMGIPMLQGRDFTTHDDASALNVAVMNESMARRYWPKGDALGHSVVVAGKPRQIVGVVHNYAYAGPDATEPLPVLFLPTAQHYESYVSVAVRSRTTASAVTAQLRQVVASLDSSLPLENVQTLEEVVGQRYQFSRIPAELLGVYALSSVLVAMLGLYAVMAYSVIERRREFALRIALGSTRWGVFRLVLRSSTLITAVGLLTGGLGSIAAVRLLRSMLFGVAPFDPASYCVAAAFLLLTVIVSGILPARRAASIEPMQALRTE